MHTPINKQEKIFDKEYFVLRKNGLIYKKYAKGPFTGLVEEFYENNNPFILRPFPCRIRNFRYGKLDGLSEWFKENGLLRHRENYKNGKQDGLDERFYENGLLLHRENYKNGKKHGSSKDFYENGQLRRRENYKNGELEGLREWFKKNGLLRHRENYKNGELDGVCEEFYSNGQLKNRGNYKNGKRHGVWEWALGGTELKREYYRNGELLNLRVIYRKVRDYFRKGFFDTLAFLLLATTMLIAIVCGIFHVPYIKITGKSCKYGEFCNVHSSHKS